MTWRGEERGEEGGEGREGDEFGPRAKTPHTAQTHKENSAVVDGAVIDNFVAKEVHARRGVDAVDVNDRGACACETVFLVGERNELEA